MKADMVRLARDDFSFYCEVTHRGSWKPFPHSLYLCNILEKVERGEIKKLIITMPPQFGKSITVTESFPSWFLGRHPDKSIIEISYSDEYARKFGGANLSKIKEFGKSLFGIEVSKKRASDTWWELEGRRGKMISAGVGGTVTGSGSDGLLLDDPIKNSEEANSQVFRDKLWDAWQGTFRTRVQPGGWIIVVHCMTGETAVTMADGTYKRLDEINPGDVVLAWKNNMLVPRRVTNWKKQGPDEIFEIKTGNSTVKANGKHPFLVDRGGKREWVPVSDLKKGDALVTSGQIGGGNETITADEAWLLGFMFGDGWVTTRDAVQKHIPRYITKSGELRIYKERMSPRRGYVTCVSKKIYPERNERVLNTFFKLFGITPKETRFGYYKTEVARVGRWFIQKGLIGKAKTKRVPEYIFKESLANREQFLLGFHSADGTVVSNGRGKGRFSINSCNEDLIRDIRHIARGCGYAVSNVSIYEAMIKAPHSPKAILSKSVTFAFNPWSKICDGTRLSKIRKIEKKGFEQVYDIEINDAECFLADGLVSHNTRWHLDDLTGRILESPEAKDWTVVHLPFTAGENDPLGRQLGDPLWPEGKEPGGEHSAEWIAEQKIAVGPYAWEAQYEGNPTPPEGELLKKSWWKFYSWDPHVGMDKFEELVQTWDLSFKDTKGSARVSGQVWGRIGANCYLVDESTELMDFPATIRAIRTTTGKWPKALKKYVEDKANGPAVISVLKNQIPGLIAVEPEGGKVSRAYAITGLLQAGNVYLRAPEVCPWTHDFIQECAAFPRGKYADRVDSMTQALVKWVMVVPRNTADEPKLLDLADGTPDPFGLGGIEDTFGQSEDLGDLFG